MSELVNVYLQHKAKQLYDLKVQSDSAAQSLSALAVTSQHRHDPG